MSGIIYHSLQLSLFICLVIYKMLLLNRRSQGLELMRRGWLFKMPTRVRVPETLQKAKSRLAY